MFLYVFRHGESEDNRNHIFSGWRNPALSEKGKIDAKELAELLKTKQIDLVFTPDLVRNTDTVREILRYHPQAKTEIEKCLQERCYGDLQGTFHLDLMKKDLSLYLTYHRSYDTPPPGGESIKQVEERVWPFCEKLADRVKEEKLNVAVCAGNNAMRVIRRFFEKLTIPEMMKIENPFDNFVEYEI